MLISKMNIIDNIKKQFCSKKDSSNKKIEDSYIGSLELKLTKDGDIDLLCKMPDINNKSADEMVILAENYAKFLLYICQGDFLQKDILDFLDHNAEKTRDPEYKLLLDNIMMFWNALNKEYKKRLKIELKDDLPLIRPISVFSNK